MKTLFAAVIATTLLAFPSAGNAAFIHDAEGKTIQPYAGWAADLKNVPAPNSNILVRQYDCGDPTALACYSPSAVEGQPGILTITPRTTKASFMHELGHDFDRTMLDGQERGAFTRLYRLKGWDDYAREVFAEAYRLCARFGPKPTPLAMSNISGGGIYTTVDFTPTPRQYYASCKFIWRASKA